MKKIIFIFLILCLGAAQGIYGIKYIKVQETAYAVQNKGIQNMNIQIGNKIFDVILEDNETTRVLIHKLPLTILMSELNGNEKYYYLPDRLPAEPKNIGNIKAGDIMLFGDNCLVIFYQNFKTSYRYTKLGHIQNCTNLDNLLGKASVKVIFKITKE